MTEDIARIEARADSLVEAHREHLRALIELRDKHELTQEMVAQRMGVSQPTVAAFEHYDSNPTLSTVRRYALAVDARINIEVIDDCARHQTGDFQEIIGSISADEDTKPRRSLRRTTFIRPNPNRWSPRLRGLDREPEDA